MAYSKLNAHNGTVKVVISIKKRATIASLLRMSIIVLILDIGGSGRMLITNYKNISNSVALLYLRVDQLNF